MMDPLSIYQRLRHQQQQQTQPSNKPKRSLSLIHGTWSNGNSGSSKNHSNSNNLDRNLSNGSMMANRLSLIKPQLSNNERYKPYDLKVRNSNTSNNHNTNGSSNSSIEMVNNSQQHHRMSKSHPIVPPLPSQSSSLYPAVSMPSSSSHFNRSKIYNNPLNFSSNNNYTSNGFDYHDRDRDSLIRSNKNKSINRHSSSSSSIDLSFKDSLIVPEADNNNNTTALPNCSTNSDTSNSNNLSTNSGGRSSQEQSPVTNRIPSIPASLVDGSTDSDANLVPKNFVDGFPAGISKYLLPFDQTKILLINFL